MSKLASFFLFVFYSYSATAEPEYIQRFQPDLQKLKALALSADAPDTLGFFLDDQVRVINIDCDKLMGETNQFFFGSNGSIDFIYSSGYFSCGNEGRDALVDFNLYFEATEDSERARMYFQRIAATQYYDGFLTFKKRVGVFGFSILKVLPQVEEPFDAEPIYEVEKPRYTTTMSRFYDAHFKSGNRFWEPGYEAIEPLYNEMFGASKDFILENYLFKAGFLAYTHKMYFLLEDGDVKTEGFTIQFLRSCESFGCVPKK